MDKSRNGTGREAPWRRCARGLCLAALALLAACGGGGGGGGTETPAPDVPTSGTISIPADSGIERIEIGDGRFVVEAWPEERSARQLVIAGADPASRFEVSVLEGAAHVRAVEVDGRWWLQLDTRGLAAGSAFAYRLQIHAVGGGSAVLLRAPVQLLSPQVVDNSTVGAGGGSLALADGSLRVVFEAQAGAAPLGVSLAVAQGAGGRQFRLHFDRDVAGDLRPLRLETDVPAVVAAAVATATQDSDGYWYERKGQFTTASGHRVDGRPLALARLAGASCLLGVPGGVPLEVACLSEYPAVRLRSAAGLGATGLAAAEPVLFVHGYTSAGSAPTLGGDGWGALPRRIEGPAVNAPGRTVVSFQFNWATDARFERVADDLAEAIDWLYTQTGRPVTIVAHSFGGVLVRTLLQGLNDKGQPPATSAKVAQVVTLGTPHSGVRALAGRVSGVDLPRGLDLSLSGLAVVLGCGQVSCHQAGEDALDDATAAMLLDDPTPGALVARLASDAERPLPGGLPILVGIGLGVSLGLNPSGDMAGGDGLISFEGQRFLPQPASDTPTLLNCEDARGARVREVALAADGALPGTTVPIAARGLVHTSMQQFRYLPARQDFEAMVPDTGDHPSLTAVQSVLERGVCPQPAPLPQPKSRLANCARPCVLAATADGRLFGAGTDPDADGAHPLGSPGVAPGPWFPLSSSLPPVRAVSSGSGSSMLAGTDGSLWVTGNGSFGRLGDGAIGSDTWKPVGGINDVRAVVGRGIASYAITGTGQLWMAGANTEGQAGYLLPPGQAFVTSWARVPTISDALRVDSNGIHSLVLRSDKTVWAAGQNSRGSESMLGFGAGGTVLNIREWRQVPGLTNIVDIATGASHSLALTEGGRIWAVGDAPSGTFSSFGWAPQLAFAEVPGIADVQSIVAGNFCSMALKGDGSLWVAGLFGVGATGAGAGAPISFAAWTRIAGAPPLAAVQTDCTRSLAIGRDGKLYVTGANELGGIGLGNPQATAGVPRETLVWTPIESLGTGF